MTKKRTSRPASIYDKASLKLHPDGSKVSSRKTIDTIKRSVQDSRGNWIANDAFGSIEVKRTKWKKKRMEREGEDEEDLGELLRMEDERYDAEQEDEEAKLAVTEISEKQKGKQRADLVELEGEQSIVRKSHKKKKSKRKRRMEGVGEPGTPPRKKRRRDRREALNEDFQFIDDTSQPVMDDSRAPSDSPLFSQLPSSDLLQSIHYFASQYYTERGQLTHQSEEWRAHRAASHRAYRARQKLAKPKHVDGSDNGSETLDNAKAEREQVDDSENRDGSEEGSLEFDEEENEATHSINENPRVFKSSKKSRIRPEEWSANGWRQDMYRMMDGSALMALGILVQTYVGCLLTPERPPGWDEDWEQSSENEQFAEGEESDDFAKEGSDKDPHPS